jgi:hypothetical protein
MSSEIRVYEVLLSLQDRLNQMTEQEVLGAHDIIECLFSYLHRVHFEEQKEVDVRALTKTMEELNEVAMQLLHDKFHRKDLFITSTLKNK